MLFRMQNNVPEAYINGSRDFQILCRAKDIIFNGVKHEIDSIRHTANTLEINSALLPLLKKKLGFFTALELPEDQLRIILAGFPYVMRYKGSLKGIKSAINLWFRSQAIDQAADSYFLVEQNDDKDIRVLLSTSPRDVKLLDALMQYILPTGCTIEYRFGDFTRPSSKYLFDSSKYEGINIHNSINSNIADPNMATPKGVPDDNLFKRLYASVGFTDIFNPNDNTDDGIDDDTDGVTNYISSTGEQKGDIT